MRTLREWMTRLFGTVVPSRRDDDLAEELRAHAELAAERGQRATGTSQAMEALRDQRGLPLFDGLWRDVRVAVRSLRATPVVTTVAILSLALAIGANTAIFSIVNALLLRPLPVREPHQLVLITDGSVSPNVRVWDYDMWEQVAQRRQLFQSAAAWSLSRFNPTTGGEARFVDLVWASGSFFDTLGVQAVLGRTFSPVDDRRGGGPDGPVAVISHGYWQRQYGGAADVIGRTVRLKSTLFTIVGVTPPDFSGAEVGRSFDIAVPLETEALVMGRDSDIDGPGRNFLTIIARLRADQSADAAAATLRAAQPHIRNAALGTVDGAVSKDFLDRYLTAPLELVAAETGFSNLRRDYRRPVLVLAVVVLLVLLIACVNIANLQLARAVGRRHELSLRRALGGPRWRLARELFTESLVLGVCGAALGSWIAAYGAPMLVRQLSTPVNVISLEVPMDYRVLMFTAVVTMLTALLFGTAPAFLAAASEPIRALKERGRATAQGGRGRFGEWLIAIQVGLSVVLVVAAALFVRSFTSLATRPLGFDPEGMVVVTMNAPQATEPSARVPLYARVSDQVRNLPDVAAAALSYLTPAGGGGFTPPVDVAAANGDVFGNLISAEWFSTYRTPIVAGRDFAPSDRTGAPNVAIVNETFVRRFFPNRNAVGETVTVYPGTPRARAMQIVGVSADAVYPTPRDPIVATWFAPIAQFDVPGFAFAAARLTVRARTTAQDVVTKQVAGAIASVDPALTVAFRPLEDQLRGALLQQRILARLAGIFGGLALVLAGIGLYGITSDATQRRRSEIGVRMALGARPAGVLVTVLARAAVMGAAGAAGGLVVSLWASKFVTALLPGVAPRDPVTLAAAVLVLSAVLALASWIPARRALRLNPIAILRAE